MRIIENSNEYVTIIQKLNELKQTHPNISTTWLNHISAKRNEYLMSLCECNNMFQIISEYKLSDMSMNDILLLQTITEIMRENKI
jgi:hypothetical protein